MSAKPEYILSKSTYIRGLQCVKSLFLNKHRSFLRNPLSEEQKQKFKRGHSVGFLARDLFPNGVSIPFPSAKAAKLTQNAIAQQDVNTIYEACFISKNVIVALDILIKKDNAWTAYEVKSSPMISQTYKNDAALQYYVITNAGLHLDSFNIIHLNSEFIDKHPEIVENSDLFEEKFPELLKENPNILNEIFVSQDVTDFCLSKQEEIEENIGNFIDILRLPNSPKIEPNVQCMNPYPCDFTNFCWKNISESEKSILLNNSDEQTD